MNTIIRKLTSRKLWVAVCGFVTLIMTARGMSDAEAAKVASIVMAGATAMAYIIGEGLVDIENAGTGAAQPNVVTIPVSVLKALAEEDDDDEIVEEEEEAEVEYEDDPTDEEPEE